MRVVSPQFNTTLSLTEMEALIRRAVKEAVHEEFVRVLRQTPASVTENWAHEGPTIPPLISYCWPRPYRNPTAIGSIRRGGWIGMRSKLS